VNVLWLVRLVADRLRINGKKMDSSRLSVYEPGVKKPFTPITPTEACAHIEKQGVMGTPFIADVSASKSRLAWVPNVQIGRAVFSVDLLIDQFCRVPEGKCTNGSNRSSKRVVYTMAEVSIWHTRIYVPRCAIST
jgi:hypothetical protein